MRLLTLLALVLAFVSLCTVATAQSMDEPRFVNKLLDDFSTPVIVPGQSGVFSLSVNNPDPYNLTGEMHNVSLAISIYQYATLEESRLVSDIIRPPLIVESDNPNITVDCGDIQPGGGYDVVFTVSTQKSTPHGSYFSQSTYFVRFILDFEYEGDDYTMASRGHFSNEEWAHLTETDTGAGELNRTYLKELGFDGIIPDSGFAVKIPIPMWPFYALVCVTIFVGLVAVGFFVLDNPGKYPKLERPLLRVNGKVNQLKMRLTRRKE